MSWSDLDELTIWQVLTQIAEEAPEAGLDAEATVRRLVLGVGTRLITSEGDSSLGGVQAHREPVGVDELSRRRASDVARLDSRVRRLVNPHVYHVSVSERLRERQGDTIRVLRGIT